MNGQGWAPLQSGDTVDIVAPGYGADKEELEQACEYLRSLKLKPRYAEDIFGRDLLCANRDEVRFGQLKAALLAEDSAAVWCLRGGYGMTRLMPEFLKIRAPGTPKLLIGLSDVTALHLFLNQCWGWPSLHGPVLHQVVKGAVGEAALVELEKIIKGEKETIRLENLTPLNESARKTDTLVGTILGGNLSLLQCSIGTPWQLKGQGRLIFIEEVDERGYRTDRMLQHLRQAGCLEGMAGLVFGQVTGGEEPQGHNLCWPVVESFAGTIQAPVFSGIASGHGSPVYPVPLATTAKLTQEEAGYHLSIAGNR